MTRIEKIMRLLAEAKREADALDEKALSFQIGTALLLGQEIAMGQSGTRPRS